VNEFEKRIGKDREPNTFKELKNALNHVRIFLKKKYKVKDIPFSSLVSTFFI